MNFWRWIPGRQNTGYDVFVLIRWWFFDVVLIRYKKGDYIKPHLDLVPGKKHYRFNICFRRAKQGGKFWMYSAEEKPIVISSPWVLFRPDKQIHGVSQVEKGERWILSIGWAIE
jgi:hypothetical protein